MFMRWTQKEGEGKPAPQSGIAYYLYIIYNNFSQIVMLNLLFLVCCIPVITAPAALVAVNRVFFKLIRERNVLFFTEYFYEFKRSLIKTIPMFIITAFLVLDSLLMIFIGAVNQQNFGQTLVVIGFFVLSLSVCFGEYVFTLMAVQDLKNKLILKNAFLLMMVGWKTTLIVFLLNFLCFVVLFFALPVSIILFFMGIVTIKQYTVCWFTNNLYNVYIIRENKKDA